MDQIFDLIQQHAWLGLAAAIVGLVVRLLKEDISFFPTIPAKWRAWAALGLGVVGGVLTSLAGGMPIAEAVMKGVAAAMIAISGHQTLIEGLRGGKELGAKGTACAVMLLGFVSVGAQSSCAAKPYVRPVVEIISELCDADIICAEQVKAAHEMAMKRSAAADAGAE